MPGDIEVEDAPTVVADDKKAVKEVKGKGRNGEEVHGRDGFAMMMKKSSRQSHRRQEHVCSILAAPAQSVRTTICHPQKSGTVRTCYGIKLLTYVRLWALIGS